MLGHIVSERRIEVDKAKVDLISKLPPPILVRQVRSLVMPDSIDDSSKTLVKFSLLCNLFVKDTPFVFDGDCLKAFQKLCVALTAAPMIRPPDWSL